MKPYFPPGLLADLWVDLRTPELVWQLGIIVASLALGYLLARLIRGKASIAHMRLRVARIGLGSFVRVLSPLISLTLMALMALMLPILRHGYGTSLLQVAMLLVGSFALIRLVFFLVRRALRKTGHARGLLLMLEKGVTMLAWFGIALYLTGLGPDLVHYLEQTVVPFGRNKLSLLTMLQAAASVVVTLILALWAGALAEQRLMRMGSVHSSLRVVLARMTRALLILVALLLSLSLVGIDLTVLSVFGGALGVGLGLGLQKIVSSYVSGIVILLERSLAIGDMVNVDRYYGQVTQINTRYTVIRGGDGIETVVPNEMLVSGPVQNYSLTDRVSRLATRVRIGYANDLDRVFALLQEAVSGVPRVLGQPAPHVLLAQFTPDGFELEIGVWITDPENGRLNVLSDVNRAIWSVLQRHHIPVPVTQHEVKMVPARDQQHAENVDVFQGSIPP